MAQQTAFVNSTLFLLHASNTSQYFPTINQHVTVASISTWSLHELFIMTWTLVSQILFQIIYFSIFLDKNPSYLCQLGISFFGMLTLLLKSSKSRLRMITLYILIGIALLSFYWLLMLPFVMRRFYFSNWDYSQFLNPDAFHQPSSQFELIEIIKQAHLRNESIKVVGAHHSFTAITNVPQKHSKFGHNRTRRLLNLDYLDRVLKIEPLVDPTNRYVKAEVTVEAGIRLYKLLEELHQRNLTLLSHGSVLEQSIAGAISTGTHGSSIHYGTLSTFITSLDLLLANGTLVHASAKENRDLFNAARTGLGCLGIITTVAIKVGERFYLHEKQFMLSWEELQQQADALIQNNDYVKFWYAHHTNSFQVYIQNRIEGEALQKYWHLYTKSSIQKFFEYQLVHSYIVPTAVYLRSFLKESWIPHINVLFKTLWPTQESVEKSSDLLVIPVRLSIHAEMEYTVDYKDWKKYMQLIIDSEKNQVFDYISEIRFVKRDNIWLSPSYQRDNCYITLTMYKLDHHKYFKRMHERITKELKQVRPHWAKLDFFSKGQFNDKYPKFEQFRAMRRQLDPQGMFMNEYLERALDL